MRKQLLLLKSLLVAVLLGAGTNAWADSNTAALTESVLATLYPNNEIANYFDFVAMAKTWNDAAEEDKATYVVTSGDASYKINKIQLYQVANPTSMNIFSVQAVGTTNAFQWRWDTNKAKYGLFNWGNARTLAFEVTEGQIVVMEGGYTATATGSCSANYVANGAYNTFTATEDGYIAFSSAGANVRALAILNPSASAVNYTVKYVDEEGTEIKDATQGTGEVGASITLTASEKASFKNDGKTKKYIYKSDDSEGKTIAGDGSTIVTITFREAETYSYTVNAMNGESKLEELATGSAFESDNVTVPFHKYYNIDGTLYQKSAISSEYRQVITVDEDEKVVEFAYTASDKTNVVFFKEAEDIETLTTTSGSGTTTRCSFAQGGYADDYAAITTLTPGKYILTGAGYGGNLVFKAGSTEVLNMATAGYWRDASSSEFTVTEDTEITFKGGASGGGASLDYVIIQQTDIAVRNAIADCKVYETSSAFATYIEGLYAAGDLTTAAEVYAAHTAWQVAQAKASGSADYSAAILNHAVTSTGHWLGTLSDGASIPYTGAPDNFYLYNTEGEGYNVNQWVYGIPAGKYEVTAYTYSSTAATRNLYVAIVDPWSDIQSENAITTSGWAKNTTTIELSAQNNLAFGFYAPAATGRTAGFDNWTLTKKGEYVTVSEAGFATYVNSDYALDFSGTAIQAYKVKVNAQGVATLTQVDGVPAGTPVLLYADGGSSEYIPIIASADAVTDNDLVAGTGAAVATTSGDYTNMILNVVDKQIGFYFANDQTVATDRAYLHIASDMAPDAKTPSRMRIVFAGETTGVKSLPTSQKGEESVYNLAGQRVKKPTKGLYVKGGKKVIVK